MIHTIAITARDVPGVLTRVAALFARRGFNVISMAVDKSSMDGLSRFTVMAEGTERGIRQIAKQLHKLIDVVKVSDLTEHPHVETEVALLNVRCSPSSRTEILRLSEVFDARVVDASRDNLILRLTGAPGEIETAVTVLKPYGLVEMARSGRIALKKASETTTTGRAETPREPARGA